MIAQFIFNALLSSTNKQVAKILSIIRQILVKVSNPLVKWKYHEFTLQLHLSHDLPFNLKEHPTYSQNLGKIAAIMAQKYPSLSVIDVGANIGDSAAIIQHKVKAPVLCIEGNPKFIPLLTSNCRQLHNISIENSFVGEVEGTVKAINNFGTAYLVQDESGEKVRTMSWVVKQHPSFGSAKLLKIDTDGYDLSVIRGSKQFLTETKASIFFEYDPFYLAKQGENGVSIFQFLVELDYTKFIIFDNIGRCLITLKTDNYEQFKELHKYFDRDGSAYMDIWALHASDAELSYS